MIFKNTFRSLFTNFNLTYKVFLYKFIVFLISFGISFAIGADFYLQLKQNGFFGEITSEVYNMFVNFGPLQIFDGFKNIFNSFLNIFTNLDSSAIILGCIAIFVFFVLYYFLSSFASLASLECINANLSSKTKISFTKSLIAKSGKSIKYSFIKLFLSIPFCLIAFCILYFGFYYSNTNISVIKLMIPFLMLVLLCIVFAFYIVLTTGFGASIIINNKGIFNGFKIGIKSTFKKFLKVYSNAFFILLILCIFNILVAVISLGAGLVISLPISYVVLRLFNIIVYYETMGMRYYVGDDIRSPIKLEEQDKLKKLKYII